MVHLYTWHDSEFRDEEADDAYAHIRATVILRAGGMCAQCGSTDEPQIDHIKPWSKGGTHNLDNLQLLCGPCNRAKGDRW